MPFGLCCSVCSPCSQRAGELLTQTHENVLLRPPDSWCPALLWPPHPQMPTQNPGPVDCVACDLGPAEEGLGT